MKFVREYIFLFNVCFLCIFLWIQFHLHSAIRSQYEQSRDVYERRWESWSHRGNSTADAIDLFDDILSEEIALNFPPTTSKDHVSDATQSTIELIRNASKIRVGDVIRVCITMYDYKGNKKTTGGDIIKLFILKLSVGSTRRGTVVDNHNGTYTGEVEAAWSGKSELVAMLEYTREAISTIYRVRHEMASLENMFAVFQEGTSNETTICHPNMYTLRKHFNYSLVCNLTYENSGMSWFCGKPVNKNLLCDDWHLTYASNGLPLTASDVELELLTKGKVNITQRIVINVSSDSNGRDIIWVPTHRCTHLNRLQSWNVRKTSGFVYKRQWVSSLCSILQLEQIHFIMANKSIYFFGDSNARAMYRSIVYSLNCTDPADTLPIHDLAWHRPTKCLNSVWNFTAHWFPHAQPFITNLVPDRKAYTTISVARRLDGIRSDEDAIVVIHIYLHLLLYHHSIFEQKMQMIRVRVAALLQRNKRAQVVILGPHTLNTYPKYPDLYGYIYSNILYKVFDGLHNKVLFLNAMEVTDTFFNQLHHPSYDIVTMMLRMIFSFV